MPYITREDGERFVIPSYRDQISVKKASLLKKEIFLLSANYGEYVTLQRKNINQYEVAFSPDTGYLLGETVWHYFKRPADLIYCEAIPNTMEAILVIVKAGNVYLDGQFPLDAISEELMIFRSQQNNFAIYVYGEIPISQTPEAGKISFDPASVQSFTVLDEPVFEKLPRIKAFQLQPVDAVLREQGIGVFPARQLISIIIVLGLLWLAWVFLTTHKKEIPVTVVRTVNPYQAYLETLHSPDPVQELKILNDKIRALFSIPGWYPISIDYSKIANDYDKGTLTVAVKSRGARTPYLFQWANLHKADLNITPEGFFLQWNIKEIARIPTRKIYPLKEVIATIVDNLSYVLPGNNLQLGAYNNRNVYTETTLTINFSSITPNTLDSISNTLRNLPLVLSKFAAQVDDEGTLSGSIVLQALGK